MKPSVRASFVGIGVLALLLLLAPGSAAAQSRALHTGLKIHWTQADSTGLGRPDFFPAGGNRRDAGVRVLRQALGYAWSVVIAADPGRAWPRFVELTTAHPDDADIRWIVRENLKKNRLTRLGLSLG